MGRLEKMATRKKTTKNEVKSTSVLQYQGIEISEAECTKKATAQFRVDYKGVELEKLEIYIKPEEHKIYYVGNKDCTGSVDL